MNAEHDQLCGSQEWADHLRDSILSPLLSELDSRSEMLEVGPGPGAATEVLRHRVRVLTAVEVDAAAAAKLSLRFAGTNVSVINADFVRAGLQADSFDAVACFTMLHHVPNTDRQHALLKEIYRVLRPGGVLVGSDSLASDDLHHFHAGDTYHPVDPTWLLVQLRTMGFNPITLRVGDELVFSARRPPHRNPDETQEGAS